MAWMCLRCSVTYRTTLLFGRTASQVIYLRELCDIMKTIVTLWSYFKFQRAFFHLEKHKIKCEVFLHEKDVISLLMSRDSSLLMFLACWPYTKKEQKVKTCINYYNFLPTKPIFFSVYFGFVFHFPKPKFISQ